MTAERSEIALGIRAIALRGWSLFWVLAALVSAVEMVAWCVVDWRSSADVRSLIGFNWRLSVPYFLLTFAASALQQLFPCAFSRWLLANRRYTGLAFAVVAGWQLTTISVLAWRFPAALIALHADSFQFVEDSIFALIVLMTVTSFHAVNRHISLTAWRRIHTTGIYLLAGLFSVNYLWYAVYRPDARYVLIALAFILAWSLRAAIWWRRRSALRGWTLFWALSALTNAAVLGTWAFVGLGSDAHVRLIISLCVGCASGAFLISFSAAPLRRLFPGTLTQWLFANRSYFFLMFMLSFAWYLSFVGVRLFGVPGSSSLVFPLPLDIAAAIAAIGVGLLVVFVLSSFNLLSQRIGATSLGLARALGKFLQAVLLTYGFLAAWPDTLTGLILVAFALAWLLQGAALLRPGAGRQLIDYA